MDGWMWRPMEAEAIYRGAPRSKGSMNRARNGLGQPAWARFRLGLPPRCFSRFLEFMPNFLWALDDVLPQFG
jgi:hypothetical protein